jgi:hypothetical protein
MPIRPSPLCWPRDIPYPQKLALTSPTCGGRSVGIIRLRTKTKEFVTINIINIISSSSSNMAADKFLINILSLLRTLFLCWILFSSGFLLFC